MKIAIFYHKSHQKKSWLYLQYKKRRAPAGRPPYKKYRMND